MCGHGRGFLRLTSRVLNSQQSVTTPSNHGQSTKEPSEHARPPRSSKIPGKAGPIANHKRSRNGSKSAGLALREAQEQAVVERERVETRCYRTRREQWKKWPNNGGGRVTVGLRSRSPIIVGGRRWRRGVGSTDAGRPGRASGSCKRLTSARRDHPQQKFYAERRSQSFSRFLAAMGYRTTTAAGSGSFSRVW